MKSPALIAMAFAVSTILFAQNTKAASDMTAFDGAWQVTMSARVTDQFKTGQ